MSTPDAPQDPNRTPGEGEPGEPQQGGAPQPPATPAVPQYPTYPSAPEPPAAGQYPPATGQYPPAAPQYPEATPYGAGQYPPSGQYPSGAQQYPGQQYPAAPYPGGGYGYVYPKNNLAVWSLVLGIVAFVLSCGFLTGIPAIIVGNNAKRAVAAGEANNGGMATAGVILGWIATALSVVGIVFFVIALAVGAFHGSVSTY